MQNILADTALNKWSLLSQSPEMVCPHPQGAFLFQASRKEACTGWNQVLNPKSMGDSVVRRQSEAVFCVNQEVLGLNKPYEVSGKPVAVGLITQAPLL